MLNTEQLLAQHKNHAAAFYALAHQAVQGVERLYPTERIMLNTEQLLAQHKNHAAAFYALAHQAVQGVERLADLNLKTMRALVEDSQARTEALFGVKDAASFVTLSNHELKLAAEKAAVYGRELQDIVNGLGNQYVKVAQGHAADAHKQFNALIETAVQNAPKGTEHATAALQAAVTNASNAYESVQKSVKQAADQTVASFEHVAQNALKTLETSVKPRKAA